MNRHASTILIALVSLALCGMLTAAALNAADQVAQATATATPSATTPPTATPTPAPFTVLEPNPIGRSRIVFTIPDPQREKLSCDCATAALALMQQAMRAKKPDDPEEQARLRPLFVRARKDCED